MTSLVLCILWGFLSSHMGINIFEDGKFNIVNFLVVGGVSYLICVACEANGIK
jgi:hypothetical protein